MLKRVRPIDLNKIGKHNAIEHDASLVHLDTPKGHDFAPIDIDQNLVDDLMNDVEHEKEDINDAGSLMSFNDVARARIRREKDCRPIDGVHQEIARGEMAIILGVWETASKGKVGVPTEWVRRWIGHEMLPDGWRPTHKQGLLNTIQRSKAIRTAMEEMRWATEKMATTSAMTPASNIDDASLTTMTTKV